MVECRGLYWVRVCGMAVFGRDLSCRMRGLFGGELYGGVVGRKVEIWRGKLRWREEFYI